jgi:hypothetical protein
MLCRKAKGLTVNLLNLFFDFAFPEQAQVHQLRRIANKVQSCHALTGEAEEVPETLSQSLSAIEARVAELERDLRFVSLVLGGVVATCETRGSITRAEVSAAMRELDAADQADDGSLDVSVLRSWSRSDAPPTSSNV